MFQRHAKSFRQFPIDREIFAWICAYTNQGINVLIYQCIFPIAKRAAAADSYPLTSAFPVVSLLIDDVIN